jgi:hypothetical protein
MIPAKQIGWSQEENLLWEISKQLDRMNSILCTGPCPTTTTTTTSSCNCREFITLEIPYNYYDCQGLIWYCTVPGECRDAFTNCIDISLPYSGITFGGVTESCNCNS